MNAIDEKLYGILFLIFYGENKSDKKCNLDFFEKQISLKMSFAANYKHDLLFRVRSTICLTKFLSFDLFGSSFGMSAWR